jgi:(1->4)-alpha-D-glucan 1-alpha-D-glucosylmutase
MTLPGVPDMFQGTELWDFSLVDPDTRRPVDFDQRAVALEKTAEVSGRGWINGAVKQQIAARLLKLRADEQMLFMHGDYRPLTIDGPGKDHAIAFAREYEDRELVVIAAMRCAALIVGSDNVAPPGRWWRDTHIVLQDAAITSSILSDNHFAGHEIQLKGMGALPALVLLRRH